MYYLCPLTASPREAFACGMPSAPLSQFRASGAWALCPGKEFYKAALGVRWPAEKVRPPREPASLAAFLALRNLLPPDSR